MSEGTRTPGIRQVNHRDAAMYEVMVRAAEAVEQANERTEAAEAREVAESQRQEARIEVAERREIEALEIARGGRKVVRWSLAAAIVAIVVAVVFGIATLWLMVHPAAPLQTNAAPPTLPKALPRHL